MKENNKHSVHYKTLILLSVGSNLGDRKANIEEAFELLKYSGAISDARISSFYETEPFGFKDQPWFINAAIIGYTWLPLNYLIEFCKSIEYILGRKVKKRWHPREIDVDIIFYGNELFDGDKLVVPHSEMHKRRFVLEPAVELAGDLIHPRFGKSIKELLADCKDKSIVKNA